MRIDNSFLSNTYSSLKQEKGLYFENKAKNESEVVGQVLGYGVDKEGFFTSDFNEAAGLPKDYRIHSDITKYFDKISNYHLAPFSSFDLARTLEKAYQAFEQVFIGINAKQSISEEDFLNLPAAFDYSFDNGKFKLHKIYNLDEYQSDVRQRTSGKKQLQRGVFQTSLFFANDPISSKDFTKLDFASAFKTNKDGTINKGELLVQFFIEANLGIVGETSIAGKIMGASGDKIAEELRSFIKQNPLFDIDMGDLIPETPQTRALLNSNLSVEQFKEKWLELQAKQTQYTEDFRKQNEENIKKEMANQIPQTTQENSQTQQAQETKPFKPIQGESKNKETYKDDNIRSEFLKKLLEDKFSTSEELKILFGMKTSDDNTSNDNFRKIISQMGLNNIKGIDIRA